MVKKIKYGIVKKNICESNECVEKAYLRYVNALIKTENFQNKLEKMCLFMINNNKSKNTRNLMVINNNVNKVMLRLMNMQNYLNSYTFKNTTYITKE